LLRSKGKNTVDGTHRNLIENERQCCCKLLKSKVNNTKRWLSTIVCVCNWRWCRLFLRYRWCSLLMISLAALRHSIVNQQCKINPPPRFLSSWWIQYYRVGQNQNRMNKPYVNTTPYFKYNTWWFPRQKRRLYNVYIYIYIYIYGFGQPYEYHPCTRITIVFPHFGVVGTVNSNGTESHATCCCCSKALVCMSIALWHFFPRGLCKLIRPSLHFCSKVDVNCTCRCWCELHMSLLMWAAYVVVDVNCTCRCWCELHMSLRCSGMITQLLCVACGRA
jgi:hypothetical protein